MLSPPSARAMETLNVQDHPAILVDRGFHILAANAAYRKTYGVTQDLTGSYCHRISHRLDRPCDLAGKSCPLRASLDSGRPERMLHVHQTSRGRGFVAVEVRPMERERPECYLEILRPTHIAKAEPSAIGLVGNSPAFSRMMDLVYKVAPESTDVLLLGESGTGKELVARAIHEGSDRAEMPFVPVECSGLARELFESELFGHRKGAFTGAMFDKPGLVDVAQGGTLFLDEIGEVSLELQVKLLRLLETQTFRKVGSTELCYADFRLVCATNCDLHAMVAAGTFRKDLFYRISTFPIRLPPLRERREDIALLACSLLQRHPGKSECVLAPEALERLEQYSFPGNIREMHNLLERARILAQGGMLRSEHFHGMMGLECPENLVPPGEQSGFVFGVDAIISLETLEQRYLEALLRGFPGTREKLASLLGISLRTLVRKLGKVRHRP